MLFVLSPVYLYVSNEQPVSQLRMSINQVIGFSFVSVTLTFRTPFSVVTHHIDSSRDTCWKSCPFTTSRSPSGKLLIVSDRCSSPILHFTSLPFVSGGTSTSIVT